MNERRLKRELRRLSRREVPDSPDLWPAIRARLSHRGHDSSPNRVGASGGSDVSSVYVWRADERRSRFSAGTRALAAGAALVLVVAVLAVLLGNHGGGSDKQLAGAGGTPTMSQPNEPAQSAPTPTPTSAPMPQPTQSTESIPSDCPVTLPPPKFVPPSLAPGSAGSETYFSYGTNDLWTELPVNGNWAGLGQGSVQKIFWGSVDYRGEGVPAITVTGQRLDAPSPALLVSQPTNASTDRPILVGVQFPTLGCWKITGTYKGHTLSFVVWVSQFAVSTPTPTAAATATPLACTPRSDQTFLQNLIDVFNRGDQSSLAAYFADDSVPNTAGTPRYYFNQLGGTGFSTDSRSDLLSIFAQRRAQHERWTLGATDFGNAPRTATGNVSMAIESDSTPLRTLTGTITIDCDQGWITFWHMTDHVAMFTQYPSVPITLPSMQIVLPSNVPQSEMPDQFSATDLGGSCDPNAATQPIIGFIAAFNRGDQQSLATFLPAASSRVLLQIKSSGKGVSSVGGSGGVLSDLARRHDAGERWNWDRIDVDSKPHGGAFRFRFSVDGPGEAAETAVGQGLLNCDSGQILLWNMVIQASTPLSQAGTVWGSVADRIGATISPLLQPAQLPDGFDGVSLLDAEPGTFVVEYTGARKDLRIGVVAGFNSPPPGGANSSQQQVSVRGQQASLVIGDTTKSSDQVWLWWYEPGTWVVKGQSQSGVLYYLSARGLTADQVEQIANGLSQVSSP